jgi:hypothetical protein
MRNNRVALLMKTRSEELNQKMADIRWWISTMKGIVSKACEGLGADTAGKVPPDTFTLIAMKNDHQYEVRVTLYPDSVALMWILDNREICDPTKDWTPRQIDYIHDHFDNVIGACESFCRQVDREKQYDELMSRFGK